jgi:hypothetical protein
MPSEHSEGTKGKESVVYNNRVWIMVRSAISITAGVLIVEAVNVGALLAMGYALFPMLSDEGTGTPFGKSRALIIIFLCQALAYLAGGYLAAWIAPRSKVRHSLMVGCVWIFFVAIENWDSVDRWANFKILMAIPICGVGGAWRSRGQREWSTPR